jgi:hypothetical protein
VRGLSGNWLFYRDAGYRVFQIRISKENCDMAKKTESKDFNEFLHETSSQRILLEEYRLLQDRYLSVYNEGVTRLNYFITAASVSIGAILVFGTGNSGMPDIYFRIILVVVLTVLAVINSDICRFLIIRNIYLDFYQRGLARIRHYFVKLDSQIKDYFVTPIIDLPTTYITDTRSGIRRIAQILEGLIVGLDISILLTFVNVSPNNIIAVGCITTILVIVLIEIIAQKQLRNAIQKATSDAKFETKISSK